MADLAINRLESYQYPNTHVGHLSPQHQAKLEDFKELCQKQGYYTARGENGRPSHDDETMLRYLRARKFSPQEAFAQFKDTEDWRKENQLDKLYDTIDVEEYDQSRRLYPQWTGRRDRRGIPVYVFEVAHLNSKAVAAYETSTSSKHQVNLTSKVPPKMLRLFALYENLVNFALPLCSTLADREYPETPVSQSNNIVDISNVGLRQFWNLKSHMQDASQLATAHYPETLDRIFIIGAPSFFPTVWGWIKRWFDPITVSKIFILDKHSMKSTLEQYIDPENIPKKYGGKLEYKFGDLPNLDSTIQKSLTWSAPERSNGQNTFPTGPVRWQKYENGDLAAVAVGSVNGKARETKVAVLKPSANVVQTSLGAGHQGHQLLRTTTGVSTHPPTPPREQVDLSDPPRPDTPEAGPSGTQASPAAATFGSATTVGAGATGGTYLSYRDAETPLPPVGSSAPTTSLPYRESGPNRSSGSTTGDNFDDAQTHQLSTDRQGTSSTRYDQQSHTHADGNVAEGTPHIEGSHGDNYRVMEPKTVGQAPKEHPLPHTEEPAAPSYLDQAKSVAGQAYGTAASVGSSALAAVGIGGQKTEEVAEEKQPESKPNDPRVDAADASQIEEFLRSKNDSGASK